MNLKKIKNIIESYSISKSNEKCTENEDCRNFFYIYHNCNNYNQIIINLNFFHLLL